MSTERDFALNLAVEWKAQEGDEHGDVAAAGVVLGNGDMILAGSSGRNTEVPDDAALAPETKGNFVAYRLDSRTGDTVWRWEESTGDGFVDSIFAAATAGGVSENDQAVVLGGSTEGKWNAANTSSTSHMVAVKLKAMTGEEIWRFQLRPADVVDDVTGRTILGSGSVLGVAADPNGDYFLAGLVTGRLTPTLGATSSGSDFFVIKLDGVTGAMLWARQGGTVGMDDVFFSAASDSVGNLIAAGYTAGSYNGATSVGGYDCVVAKFNPDGVLVWSHQDGSSEDDTFLAVAIDDQDNVYAAGGYELLDSTATNAALPTLHKLDGSTGVPMWIYTAITPSTSTIFRSVTIDQSTGLVVCAGVTDGRWARGEPSDGRDDFALALVDYDTGEQFGRWHEGTVEDDVFGFAGIGPDGSVYLGGCTDGSWSGENQGETDFAAVKFAPLNRTLIAPVVSTPARSETSTKASSGAFVGPSAELSSAAAIPAPTPTSRQQVSVVNGFASGHIGSVLAQPASSQRYLEDIGTPAPSSLGTPALGPVGGVQDAGDAGNDDGSSASDTWIIPVTVVGALLVLFSICIYCVWTNARRKCRTSTAYAQSGPLAARDVSMVSAASVPTADDEADMEAGHYSDRALSPSPKAIGTDRSFSPSIQQKATESEHKAPEVTMHETDFGDSPCVMPALYFKARSPRVRGEPYSEPKPPPFDGASETSRSNGGSELSSSNDAPSPPSSNNKSKLAARDRGTGILATDSTAGMDWNRALEKEWSDQKSARKTRSVSVEAGVAPSATGSGADKTAGNRMHPLRSDWSKPEEPGVTAAPPPLPTPENFEKLRKSFSQVHVPLRPYLPQAPAKSSAGDGNRTPETSRESSSGGQNSGEDPHGSSPRGERGSNSHDERMGGGSHGEQNIDMADTESAPASDSDQTQKKTMPGKSVVVGDEATGRGRGRDLKCHHSPSESMTHEREKIGVKLAGERSSKLGNATIGGQALGDRIIGSTGDDRDQKNGTTALSPRQRPPSVLPVAPASGADDSDGDFLGSEDCGDENSAHGVQLGNEKVCRRKRVEEGVSDGSVYGAPTARSLPNRLQYDKSGFWPNWTRERSGPYDQDGEDSYDAGAHGIVGKGAKANMDEDTDADEAFRNDQADQISLASPSMPGLLAMPRSFSAIESTTSPTDHSRCFSVTGFDEDGGPPSRSPINRLHEYRRCWDVNSTGSQSPSYPSASVRNSVKSVSLLFVDESIPPPRLPSQRPPRPPPLPPRPAIPAHDNGHSGSTDGHAVAIEDHAVAGNGNVVESSSQDGDSSGDARRAAGSVMVGVGSAHDEAGQSVGDDTNYRNSCHQEDGKPTFSAVEETKEDKSLPVFSPDGETKSRLSALWSAMLRASESSGSEEESAE